MKMNELYQKKLLDYNLGDDMPNKMLKTNFCSVASILSIQDVHAILGADLEVNTSKGCKYSTCVQNCQMRNERGWCNVFDYSQYFSQSNYDYIKIPHHSSDNGYCPRLWSQYMTADAIGTSTIFLQGKVFLPQDTMMQIYSSHCKELYYTSSLPTSKKDKKGKSKLDEVKNIALEEMVVANERIGVITSRKQMNSNGLWKTNFYESAIRVK